MPADYTGSTSYEKSCAEHGLILASYNNEWLFLDDIAAKTGFMVTEKGERAFQGIFYAARFLLNERDFCFFGEAIAEPKNQKSSSFKRNQAA